MTFDFVSILIASAIFLALTIPMLIFVTSAKKDALDLIQQVHQENAEKENGVVGVSKNTPQKQRLARSTQSSIRRRSSRT